MGLESEERSVLGVRDQPHHHGGEQETEPNPRASAERHRRILVRFATSFKLTQCRSIA